MDVPKEAVFMQIIPIINLILGSTGLLGVLFIVFRSGKIVEKIDTMDKRIDKLEQKVDDGFKKVDDRFKKLEENLPTINIAITRLEVRLEERTLRTVDIIKHEKLEEKK